MERQKKIYIAPAAELILLAPTESLAAPTTADDAAALQKWGSLGNGAASTASAVQGTSSQMWLEDGTIIKTQ